MGWHVWCNEFGIDIPMTFAKDSEGVVTGYHFECPFQDLQNGFDSIQPATFGVNRDSTREEQTFLQETFGDILPVCDSPREEQTYLQETFGDILPVIIRSGTYGNNYLTQRLMRLMTMETFFLAMYDCPDKPRRAVELARREIDRFFPHTCEASGRT
jgi:hypothetical protein